jgi:hypothetical protein
VLPLHALALYSLSSSALQIYFTPFLFFRILLHLHFLCTALSLLHYLSLSEVFSLWALAGSSLTSRPGVQCDEHTSHSTHTPTKSQCHQYYYSNQHRAFSNPISVLSIHENQSTVFDLFLELQWTLFQSKTKALLKTNTQTGDPYCHQMGTTWQTSGN